MDPQEEDFGIEQQAFEVLEREFQEVLNELSSDPRLESFRIEYEKLHRALKLSHDNEKKLLTKCKTLNEDIMGNVQKVQKALKLTQEDSQTINLLKTELDKTYKLLELTKEREEKSKQKIENLHTEIKTLNASIEKGNSLASGQNNTVHELLIRKEELIKEKEMLTAVITNVKFELNKNQEKLKNIEQEKENLNKLTDVVKLELSNLEEKIQKDDEQKKKNQEELEQIKKKYDTSRNEFEKLYDEKRGLTTDNERFEIQIHEKHVEIEKMEKEQKILKIQDQDGKNRIEDLRRYQMKLEEYKNGEEFVKKQKENEMKLEMQQFNRLKKQNEKMKSEAEQLRYSKLMAEQLKDLTKMSINELEKEVSLTRKHAQDDHQQIEDMKRNRDVLQKEVNRAENNNKKQMDDLNIKNKTLKEKDNEISGQLKEQEQLSKKIANLEKEKEKYGIQAASANAKYFHSLEEIKLKDNLISEFQKKNIETEAKLKQQQNLYEAVRSDRSLYCKKLTETQEEITEIKRRYKIVNHSISQLKEEIDAKEIQLSKEHFEHKKKDKQIEENKKVQEKFKKDIYEKEQIMVEYKEEVEKLHSIIRQSEQYKQKLKEEYDLVVSERDILSSQLIRRNEEAALLYEKIKINQSYLAKGEDQYKERLGDIEILKQKIADLMNEIKGFKVKASAIADLKNEVHNLEKELIDERLKVKSLSEEIENPINVHRWRKLEATDSETYELMTKIHTLQKRLIYKTEEVQQKENLINQREKTLKELRETMKRQPGIEEAKMIQLYQESLQQKKVQMKAMLSELRLQQNQVQEYKNEIERINKELLNVKKNYYEQKKREQYENEKEQNQKQIMIQINLPEKRFAGGGFNLAI